MRLSSLLILFTLIFLFSEVSSLYAYKIGVVDLNRALNESEVGIRSKSMLENKGRAKQQSIKMEDEDIRKMAEELRNNPLLSMDIKRQKEEELKQRQTELREKVREFEQDLRQQEQKLTGEIFKELKTIIRTVSIQEKFDFVLEKNAAEVILYMKETAIDITQKVIDYYNKLQSPKP